MITLPDFSHPLPSYSLIPHVGCKYQPFSPPRQDLKELTNIVHYENYRAEILEHNGQSRLATTVADATA